MQVDAADLNDQLSCFVQDKAPVYVWPHREQMPGGAAC